METMLASRYRLGDRIGTGGSSHVYRAHDVVLDRPVAVKLLDEAAATTADPALRRRFESESRTGARFIHPHAVAIFDAGADQGQLFLVMELVTGGTLAERLSTSGPMPSADAARLGAQIASALAAAHATGIIHRDVKPANVLLDDHGNAKLADFGIARRFDEIEDSLTSTGMVMGTRHYVSPEQAYGQPLGPATDIFSLGVLLYEAVTGVRPPSAIERPPDRPLDVRTVDPSIDPRLAEVIARATAVPVEARFVDAGQMAAMLTAAATATPGTTAPPLTSTALMPEHLRPTPADAAAASTTAHPLDPGPSAGGRHAAGGRSPPRRTTAPAAPGAHRAAVIALLLVGGALAAALAIALDDGDEADLPAAPTTAPAVEAATTVAPPTTPVTTITATTLAPTTVAPTTVAPTTVAPTTVTPTVPQELIPGFPVPVDFEDFLRILAGDPDLVGKRGDDLFEEFDELLDGPPGRRDDRQDDLRDDIQRWSDDDELDPIIAAVAIHYLDELPGHD